MVEVSFVQSDMVLMQLPLKGAPKYTAGNQILDNIPVQDFLEVCHEITTL